MLRHKHDVGRHELIHAHASQRSMLEKRYPDAVFALQIISNPFLKDWEAGSIQMEAYSAILNGKAISDIRSKYDRQMDAYVARHNWD